MADESPGLLQVIATNRKDTRRCIICQKIQDHKGDKKLTSTERGRQSIISYSRTLQDDLLYGLLEIDYTNIKYHVNTCYSRYMRGKKTARKHSS